jgi:hypothetical protein
MEDTPTTLSHDKESGEIPSGSRREIVFFIAKVYMAGKRLFQGHVSGEGPLSKSCPF